MKIEPTPPIGPQAESHRRGPGDAPLDWQKKPEQADLPATFQGKTFAEILALMMQAQEPATETAPSTASEPALHPVQLEILQALAGGTPLPTDGGMDVAQIIARYTQTMARDADPPNTETQG